VHSVGVETQLAVQRFHVVIIGAFDNLVGFNPDHAGAVDIDLAVSRRIAEQLALMGARHMPLDRPAALAKADQVADNLEVGQCLSDQVEKVAQRRAPSHDLPCGLVFIDGRLGKDREKPVFVGGRPTVGPLLDQCTVLICHGESPGKIGTVQRHPIG